MEYIHANCAFCGKPVVRKPQAKSADVKIHFCDLKCKSEYQKLAKPVTREWLYEQYVVLGRNTTEIGFEVGRDPKSVWNWLKDFGIPTRGRGFAATAKFEKGHKLNVGRKLTEATKRKMSEIAKATGRVPYDPRVGSYMKGKKGDQTPNWKGGITPERQSFCASDEWKAAVRRIKKRDNNTCQVCGYQKVVKDGVKFEVHHIVSFKCVELRLVDSNLILFCEKCHDWVHSNANEERKFILPCP